MIHKRLIYAILVNMRLKTKLNIINDKEKPTHTHTHQINTFTKFFINDKIASE